MINSFLNTTKTIENSTKNCNSNCICRRERRFNNGKNDAHILRNVRQKNEYNNHRFYMGNEKDDSKNTNLSEMYSKIHRWDLYKCNSKPKKEENEIRLSIKTKNHNYHNINTAYHSFEKKEKIYERNTYDNKNSNNIKLIENEVYTPRLNNKSKNIVYQKNCNDLSKTMNNFKNRDNYGYHEIKDVKKNNNVNQNNNNNSNQNKNKNNKIKTESKNTKKNIPNYLSINISNNSSFRRSLNINNNTGTSNNINNNTNSNNNNIINYNTKNNIKKNELNNNNNVNDANKNSNQRKNSYLNFKTAQNYFNPQKNIIKEESNNYSSYKNIKEPKKEIKNEKPKINETNDNNKNLNNSLLIRKIYIKSTPEDKRPKNCNGSRVNIIKRNNLMNTNIFFNNKENDKNIINSNRFLSGEFKEIVKDEKKDKIINGITNTEKKISNSKIPTNKINKINKMYSPIKKENSKIINHLKQNSYLNCNTNSTEKKVSKRNEKYEINHIFKKVEKNNLNKLTTRKNKNEKINETKIPNAHRINEKTLKVNSKDKNNNSIILQTNDSLRRLKEKTSLNINISKEKDEIHKTNENIKNTNINTNTYIKKCIKKYEGKDIKNNIKNYIKPKQKNEVNNNNQSKPNNKYNNNPFNREDNTKKKDINDDKNKNSYKFLIKKKCKSIEKNDNKNNEELPKQKSKKKLRSRTKTKSKAKKHSDKVKYLDKLKIFKYSETNYNINYESSTNCSKDNYDYRYKKFVLKSTRSHSKKKKNINSFNLNYKTFEEDFKINKDNINEKYQNLKPQISVRITLSKQNNVNIAGILRYFKVNYFCSENLRNKYDYDSEDTSEFYNAKF